MQKVDPINVMQNAFMFRNRHKEAVPDIHKDKHIKSNGERHCAFRLLHIFFSVNLQRNLEPLVMWPSQRN